MSLPFTLDADELIHAVTWDDAEIDSLDELEVAIARCGRNASPRIVADLWDFDAVPRWWLPRLVTDAWCDAEFPMVQLDPDEWRHLFTAAGYTFDGRRRARPRKPARLYRGADHDHRDGWSWTTDLHQARWFANRPIHRSPGRVWVADVHPARMLAKIGHRREGEVVVDTADLTITEYAEES